MSPGELTKHYPMLYHMAEANTWDSISRHGLLSTSALLDLFEINGEERAKVESEHRPHSVEITHPRHGTAMIRDQIPLREGPLDRCLVDMSRREWYETLNGKVFFWLTRDRVERLLNARAYREREHCVITIDTGRLLEQHIDRITLSPINSGSTLFNPRQRGRGTFLPVSEYPFDQRRRTKSINDAVVELAVEYSVPDISTMVLQVQDVRASDF